MLNRIKKVRIITPEASKDRGEKSFVKLPKFGAKMYDKMMRLSPMQLQRREIAEDLVKYIKSGTLLDVGTGHGRILREICNLNPEIDLYGLDISEKMIEIAKENLEDIPATLKSGNISNPPYEDNVFDIVTSTGSLYLWDLPITSINEIHRILKNGGLALIYESHKEYDETEIKKIVRSNLQNESWFSKKIVPLFLNKQLKMTYDIPDLKNLIENSLFQSSYEIEKITLANLPIWLRIKLKKE
jgi:ubiquinone/menaquinone biosynthesis C-methylase UbiE